ncbi:MAG: serine/threonine-protein kinase [Phormidesmis sp.]
MCLPTRLHNYRLLALVGQGQFAQVYCAVHRRTGRLVAIKQTRHARETQSQAPFLLPGLKHPNVVPCYAATIRDGGYQLVLDYCEGGTLRSHLTRTYDLAPPLSLLETQSLIGGLLKGLRYLHQQDIIHDDLKPENIFLTYSTEGALIPKIGDFGSAHLIHNSSQSRREIGSPTYAAPERFEGYASIASDLYSVGVMLYELLIGDRPFSGQPSALKQAHQTQPVYVPSSLPSALQTLLLTALHKQPQQRFTTADDMLKVLQSLSAVNPFVNPPIKLPIQSTAAAAFPSFVDFPTISLAQVAQPISSHGITAPIDALISTPQGCCIVTARSLHLLTPKRELLSIAQFRHPCWIAVDPSGRWFVAFPKKKPLHIESYAEYRQTQGMLGRFSHRSGHRWRRSLSLPGPLLTALCADVLQLIALDSRYLLRVSTAKDKTYLECFTRRGQLIGELSLNIRLTQVLPTAIPYQLIALSTSEDSVFRETVVLITLKPLKVRQIRLPNVSESVSQDVSNKYSSDKYSSDKYSSDKCSPMRVSTLPWGYAVSYHRGSAHGSAHDVLLLDSLANVTSVITDVPQACAIAAIDAYNILLASLSNSITETSLPDQPSAYKPQSNSPPVLLTANVKSLDLGMIF